MSPTRHLMLLCLLACTLTMPARAEDRLRGNLTSIGSDTLGGLMTRWGEAFRAEHTDVAIQVQAPGSGSAPQALIEGSASLGPMSRPMGATEIAAFRARHGHDPSRITIGIDAVAVIVHPESPLAELSLAQLDALFSATRYCAPQPPIDRWSQLVAGGSDVKPLLIGRNSASGTHEFFRQQALCDGDFRAAMLQLPGAGAIVQMVSQQPAGIGFVGVGVVNPSVRTLALARDGAAAEFPSSEAIRSGAYPLSRPLFLYFNRAPDAAMPLLLDRYFRFILGARGQALVAAEGLVPLSADQVEHERKRLQLPIN